MTKIPVIRVNRTVVIPSSIKKSNNVRSSPKVIPQANPRVLPPINHSRIQHKSFFKTAAIKQPIPTNRNQKVVSIRHHPNQAPKPVASISVGTVPQPHIDRWHKSKNLGVGKIAIILGNGPSLTEIPIELLRDCTRADIFLINKPDHRLWPSTYWVFFDVSQYRRHTDYYNNYNGTIITTPMNIPNNGRTWLVRNLGQKIFALDPAEGICIGRSSIYATLQIATYFNYEHIYVLGVDMAAIEKNGKQMVWSYGQNPDVTAEDRIRRFNQEAEYYDTAGRTLPEHLRKKITFCSSYLKYDFTNYFNKIDHKDSIPQIMEADIKLRLPKNE